MRYLRPCLRSLTAAVLLVALATTAHATGRTPLRDATPAFATMATAASEYLNDSTDCPGLVSAAQLFADLDAWTVVDLRQASAYEAGHIPWARHSSLGTLLDDLEDWMLALQEPIVLVCYTGQVSAYAKVALELVGYENVRALNWGMADWNPALSLPWDANVADELADPETADQNGNLTSHEFPELSGSDPQTVIAQRVGLALAMGYRGIRYRDIMADLDDYFIVNYFGPADYAGEGDAGAPGHVPGSFQFTPHASLAMDQMLETIPTDMPVVVYDWTGQHAAQVVAVLVMLGYDARNLNFGAQSLFHSSLVSHRWNGCQNDFPLEDATTAAPDDLVAVEPDISCWPNPFNPRTTIAFELGRAGPAQLQVLDLAGRVVTTLADGRLAAGHHERTWTGCDARGRAMPSGVYLVRLIGDARVTSERVTLRR